MPFHKNRLAAKKGALKLRSTILRTLREFFSQRDYTEVETPCRIPLPIPEAHIRPEPSGTWFLLTSPEICMKQMLAAGYDRIYQICRCFRQGERGRRHLPEFTLLEWYAAGKDYRFMMRECELLFAHLAGRIRAEWTVTYRGTSIDLNPPWPRRTVAEAFNSFSPVPLDQAMAENRFDEMIGLHIEPHLGIDKPEFLIDYPAALGALARCKPGNPQVAERFGLYIGGVELCNGFSELTDPDEQRRRFALEQHARKKAGRPQYPIPETFLAALSSMPEAAGNAMGLDRLVMLFADATEIDDVAAFAPEDL